MLREPDTIASWMRRSAGVAVLLALGVVVLGADGWAFSASFEAIAAFLDQDRRR